MNAIELLVQSIPAEVRNKLMKAPSKTGEATPFFSMLLQQHQQATMLTNEANAEDVSGVNVNLIELIRGMNDEEIHRLLGTTENISVSSIVPSDETNVDKPLKELDVNTDIFSEQEWLVNPIFQEAIAQLDDQNITTIPEQLATIIAQVENLLSEVDSKQDIRKIAPKILELLKQWTVLENQLIRTNVTENNSAEATSIKVNQVWKELIVAYENRSKLTAKNQYQNDSQVTTKDVVKWLENALHNQQIVEKTAPVQSVNNHVNTAMPKLEQYVIFVNQNQGGQVIDSQLMDQFQQVIKTSKFLATPNGVNQLSVALRPENLGEMMIRLTEINGEMTVKIVVSTQAAKEMLESNINQLRHMFSPQQVVIERQDIGAGQGQNQSKQSDEQSLLNQNQSQSDESTQQEKNSSETDFEAHLDELIQNVKV